MISIFKKLKNRLEEIIEKICGKSLVPIVPIVSGGAALGFLYKIIFSDLSDWKYAIAIVSVLTVFAISAYLFWKLKWFEREKDQHLLSTVGNIVENVFKHYGVAMASNAAGPTTAEQMNPIMQTIVNLVKELNGLIDKTYTKN